LRIISGTHKSRTIHAPGNLPVRPTTDFAKEGLFNVLGNHFDFSGLKILDLFSGTGNITYEFVSRGCTEITAVDVNYNCCSFIKKTASEMGFNNVKVIKADVFSYLKKCIDKFDLIFADPPFEMEKIEQIPSMVFEKGILKENGWLIVEHSVRTELSKERLLQKRDYGKVNFSIFS
jgi:16S rRNA (guanine966-N2)-methyltransferase